jgi:TolB-like protein/tetratricopeptide (TPR) repeat protein
VTEVSRAVFLSYASQDAQAARRIGEALRVAGIEVWLDQSELRGGDAWDQKIRREIHDCALFIPVISAHTASRHEGYFRLEWDLADQRTHKMARNHVFVVPVCLDATPEQGADVPESFQRVQWTRLPAGETPPGFVERMRRLLWPELATGSRPPVSVIAGPVPPVMEHAPSAPSAATPWGSQRTPLVLLAVVLIGAGAYFAIEKPWTAKPPASPPATPTIIPRDAPAAFSPPPHSIAVLPFVNLSGDKEQEYFSDGLTEELLNSLAEINELQVAARTSAFSFKGQNTDIATIAHKLNVGSVLEGSVRRSGHTIRITAQLINATTGFHLWSKTYDRDLGDVLKLQTDIATAVAQALKVTLLGDVSAKIEVGGTRNPAAFDAYLRAATAQQSRHDNTEIPAVIAAYTEAIRLDPTYALAYVGRSCGLSSYAGELATGAAIREGFEKAEADARHAIALAPDLAQAHAALGGVLEGGPFDFAQASQEYERALALAPGNAEVLRSSSAFAARTGHFDAAIAAPRKAVVLDPLDRRSHSNLGLALYLARRYADSTAAFADAIRVRPDFKPTYASRGFAFIGLGDLQSARSSCEAKRDDWYSQLCLAVVYEKLGQRADAEAELAKLKKLGDAAAYQYAQVDAQWGDRAKALEWLDAAIRLRDPGLVQLKTDPLMDPLHQEPRFQAALRELKFPG